MNNRSWVLGLEVVQLAKCKNENGRKKMTANLPAVCHLQTADAAVTEVKRVGKRVITFLGFSGRGYEDTTAVRKIIEDVLATLEPSTALINAGGTKEGIGMVYPLARRHGFTAMGIVSSLALAKEGAFSPDAHTIYVISDELWGGKLPNGTLSPTSSAMVGASDEMVAIGGDEIARDELSVAMAHGKPVRYFAADMNHLLAARKAADNDDTGPLDFKGAAHQLFVKG
jgi:hypothetical protein